MDGDLIGLAEGQLPLLGKQPRHLLFARPPTPDHDLTEPLARL